MPSASSNRRVVKVGLTGGFGTGKSTVLKFFKDLGARTFDADSVVHDLFASDRRLKRAIAKRFDAVGPDGSVDRKALSRIVFDRPSERRALERIVHPAVRSRIVRGVSRVKTGVAVVDVPLLFESGWNHEFDLVIVVSAGRRTRIRRLAARGYGAGEFARRARAQWPLNKKKRLADYVIDNDGTPANTKRQVAEIWQRITNHARVVRGKNGLA